ncbi:hypothetical protein IW252_001216 [Zhihengliuella flava]|uniref:Uncharacterized protein n=1 Tax=Zhihengliuella flava TaxID=1285193 RepID=A0A931D4U8_9MICC|nr:hypothetical protein [Zhihengliuella flava]MBG6084449.1 hypothetical protein [Zhihengliuella flava]
MTTGHIAERTHLSDLDEHRALCISAERHPCFEENIRPSLRGRLDLDITITVAVARLQTCDLVWGHEHDDGWGVRERSVEHLSDVRQALAS